MFSGQTLPQQHEPRQEGKAKPRMSNTTTHVADAGDMRKYRIELPNLVDDMDLSPYAFRLYVHLKRVAGGGNDGACWESTRTLASKCRMSAGQISKAKQELVNKGLITVEKRKSASGPDSDYITLADMWAQNYTAYSAGACSPHEQACSSDERPCSPYETKKEPVKKEPVKKGGAAAATVYQGHPPQPLATSTGNGASVSVALQHPTVKKVQVAFGVNLTAEQVQQLAMCDDQAAVDATIDDYRKNTNWRRNNTQVFYERYLKNRDAIEAARPQPKTPRPWELEPAPEVKQIATPEEKRAAVARVLANHPRFAALAQPDAPAVEGVTA
jgi:hypothetical protein